MTATPIQRAAIGAFLAASACMAQAATVQLNDWAYGSGGTVNASAPVYTGQAGAFAGTLDGDAFVSYCIELTQSFHWDVAYANYSQVQASSYFTAPGDKALRLGRLLSYVEDTTAVTTAAQSTSLQLAVWNIVYDTDDRMGPHNGATFSDRSGYAGYATALLNASKDHANTMDLWVLASATSQDQLIWRRAPSLEPAAVPEPASLALALVGIAAAGAATRRRSA